MAKGDAKRIERILLKVAGELVGVLQLRAYQAVSSATPVDTGNARSNWFPSVGSPITSAFEIESDKATARVRAAKQSAENLARARSIESSYDIAQGRVFLTNATSYIVYLNAGSSAQAPTMFVERAVLAAVLSLRNFRPRSAA